MVWEYGTADHWRERILLRGDLQSGVTCPDQPTDGCSECAPFYDEWRKLLLGILGEPTEQHEELTTRELTELQVARP